MNFYDIAIFTAGENNYRINSWFVTKSKAVDRIKNAKLNENNGPEWLGRKIKNYQRLWQNQKRHRERKISGKR